MHSIYMHMCTLEEATSSPTDRRLIDCLQCSKGKRWEGYATGGTRIKCLRVESKLKIDVGDGHPHLRVNCLGFCFPHRQSEENRILNFAEYGQGNPINQLASADFLLSAGKYSNTNSCTHTIS